MVSITCYPKRGQQYGEMLPSLDETLLVCRFIESVISVCWCALGGEYGLGVYADVAGSEKCYLCMLVCGIVR